MRPLLESKKSWSGYTTPKGANSTLASRKRTVMAGRINEDNDDVGRETEIDRQTSNNPLGWHCKDLQEGSAVNGAQTSLSKTQSTAPL